MSTNYESLLISRSQVRVLPGAHSLTCGYVYVGVRETAATVADVVAEPAQAVMSWTR